MRKISREVSVVLRRFSKNIGFLEHIVRENWDSIIGTDLAKHADLHRISIIKSGDLCVYLKVSPTDVLFVRYNENVIKAEISKYVGTCVSCLKIVQNNSFKSNLSSVGSQDSPR
jgi:hypothetical protein